MPKKRNKEEMREYQRQRRAKRVTPDVTPPECNAQNVTPKPEVVTPIDDKLVTIDGVPKCVLTVTDSSPDWKKEPAYLERIHYLKDTPLEQLQAEGGYIPCWKHAMEAAA